MPPPNEPKWPVSARSRMRQGNDTVSRILFILIVTALFAGAGAFSGGASHPKRGYRERDAQTGQMVHFRDSPEKSRRRIIIGGIAGGILGLVLSIVWWKEPFKLESPHESPKYLGQWRSGGPG